MKRKNLAKFENECVHVRAKIERFGLVNTETDKLASMLLSDVSVTDGSVTEKVDHVWLRINKQVFETCLNLTENTYIAFDATVKTYYLAPDYETLQGYCFRKTRNLQVTFLNKEGVSLHEFISFREQLGMKVRRFV